MWDDNFRRRIKSYYNDIFKIDETKLDNFLDILSENITRPQLYILSSRWIHITVAERKKLAEKYVGKKHANDFVVFMGYFYAVIVRYEDE